MINLSSYGNITIIRFKNIDCYKEHISLEELFINFFADILSILKSKYIFQNISTNNTLYL